MQHVKAKHTSEIKGLYAIWYRELLVFMREPSRLVGAIIQPLLWLVIFGTGLGSIIEPGAVSGANYQQFLFPGILVMTVLFGSLFFGLYIILDKRIDFLKEVLVAPLNKSTMFFGKALGGSTDGLLQIIILMILGAIFFGIHFTLLSIILTFVIVIFIVDCGYKPGAWRSARSWKPGRVRIDFKLRHFPVVFLERSTVSGYKTADLVKNNCDNKSGFLFR